MDAIGGHYRPELTFHVCSLAVTVHEVKYQLPP